MLYSSLYIICLKCFQKRTIQCIVLEGLTERRLGKLLLWLKNWKIREVLETTIKKAKCPSMVKWVIFRKNWKCMSPNIQKSHKPIFLVQLYLLDLTFQFQILHKSPLIDYFPIIVRDIILRIISMWYSQNYNGEEILLWCWQILYWQPVSLLLL